MNALYVFIGGGLGALCRWGIAQLLQNNSSGFPLATFTVNLLGCFCIGLLSALLWQNENKLQLLVVVGFLGGFTTFSAFGLETFRLYEAGNFKMLSGYVILSNLFGFLCVILGNRIMASWL